jgi:hypothetical protein
MLHDNDRLTDLIKRSAVAIWTSTKNDRTETVETDKSYHTKRKTRKRDTERQRLEFMTICKPTEFVLR